MYRVNTSSASLNKGIWGHPCHGCARRRAGDVDDARLWRKQRHHGISPSLQGSYRDESIAVSETDEIAQGSPAAYCSWPQCGRCGHEVGYESTTQFSRECARLFGRPPCKKFSANHIGNEDLARGNGHRLIGMEPFHSIHRLLPPYDLLPTPRADAYSSSAAKTCELVLGARDVNPYCAHLQAELP